VYTASAVEGWFANLSGEWEDFFNDHELSLGRQLYQSGMVSSIELQEKHAIIHGKVDGKEVYALVEEWGSGSPAIRTSSTEPIKGRALVVAGLYEAEELLTDTVSPLPPETREEQPAARRNKFSTGLFADSVKPTGLARSPTAPILPRVTPAPGTAAASRALLVKLSSTEEGLALDAFWKSLDGGASEPALKLYKQAAAQISESERESIIRLTALARKNGFELGLKKHDYLLKDFSKIPAMVKTELDIWQKYFELDLTPEVLHLAKGSQIATVEVTACEDGENLRFNWLFLLKGCELTKEQIRLVLKAGRGTALIPSLGLVKLSDEQADIVADWQEAILNGSGSVPKYMLFSIFRQDALPIRLSKDLEGWTHSLLEEPSPMRALPECLRDYQKKGVAWLQHMLSHGCHPLLADEMGLGKTLQVLSLIGSRAADQQDRPSLIVSPASVVPVWVAELSRHFPNIRPNILSQENPLNNKSRGIWLASYGQLKRHAAELPGISFEYAILDEAQMIKNPKTKSAKVCYGISAQKRLVMTGTPIENRPMDLWSIFRFLMPGLLGGSTRFEALDQASSPALIGKLHQQVSPFILRRTKTEVAKDLPEKVEAVITVPMSALQRTQYERLVEQGIKRFGNDLRRAGRERGLALFTLLTRLRQVSCDPGLLPWVNCAENESGKINALLERLEEIVAAGSKVVLFSQFVSFLHRIRSAVSARLPNLKIFELTGATMDRQGPVSEFQQHNGTAVMLVSLRAGGTGITLHSADYLFLMDPWWNPAVEDQAIDRIHRIGQKNTVFVYRIVSEGTVEARIQALKSSKKELFQNIVGAIRDNTHFTLYFKSMSDLIALAPKTEEEENGEE
jgi:superfamily II DNA or RNA helicase